MSKEKILIVEDEQDILELVRYNLEKEGYEIIAATDGKEALASVQSNAPDLVILDLMLPELDGLEVCKRMKNHAESQNIPIIMLTAKGEEADIVTGLELGADDYITKPFSLKVLLSRVRAVLRRVKQKGLTETDILKIHNLVIHPGRHEVKVDGEAVELTLTEFRILHLLARRPGWVFTRYQIVDAIRGDDYPVTDRSVDVQIVGLRRKLADYGKHIETVRGVGYRFRE